MTIHSVETLLKTDQDELVKIATDKSLNDDLRLMARNVLFHLDQSKRAQELLDAVNIELDKLWEIAIKKTLPKHIHLLGKREDFGNFRPDIQRRKSYAEELKEESTQWLRHAQAREILYHKEAEGEIVEEPE